MNTTGKTPFVVIAAQGVVGLFVFFYILYIGQGIILPVIYAAIIAILLNPLVNWLCHHRVSRVLAIFIAVILLLLIFGGLVYFVVDQSMRFGDSLPVLQQKMNSTLETFSQWIQQRVENGEKWWFRCHPDLFKPAQSTRKET